MNIRARARRSVVVITMVTAAALLLAGCSTSSSDKSTSAAVVPSNINVALTAEPTSLDPLATANLVALTVFSNVFDRLVDIDDNGKLVGDLATSWKHDDALTTWTFTLRKDVKFQDGTPLTSADVAFTINQIMGNPTSALKSYVSSVASVTATDATTVTFTLNKPYIAFDRQMVMVSILPEKTYTSMGAEAFALKPVGSGPYSVSSWSKGDSIILARNKDYFGAPGKFKTVTLKPVVDETTRANAALSGELDVALVGPTQFENVKASDTVGLVQTPSNRLAFMGYNVTNPNLADANLRKALDLSIDRDAIATGLLQGSVKPAGQLVSPVTFGYDKSIKATDQDLSKAKALVKASGYDGSTIPLSFINAGLPQIQQVAEAIVADAAKIGVKVSVDTQEYSTFLDNFYAKKFTGLFLFSISPPTLDSELTATLMLGSSGYGYVKDTQIDDLITAEGTEADSATRAADFAKIEQISNENTYYSPLYEDSYSYAITKGLDWTPGPTGIFQFNR